MARRAKTKTKITDYRRELETRMQRLDELESRRDQLLGELAQVEEEMSEVAGGGSGGTTTRKTRRKPGPKPGRKKTTRKTTRKTRRKPGPKPGRKKTAKKTTRKTGRRRGRQPSGESLVDAIRGVLADHSEGMRVRDICDAVQKAGYKSQSKDFYAIVAKTLLENDDFKRVSRGVYALK